jgi:hypothetical protein
MKKLILSFLFFVFSANSAGYLTSEGVKYHTTEEFTQSVKLVSNHETLALDNHCIVSTSYNGKKIKSSWAWSNAGWSINLPKKSISFPRQEPLLVAAQNFDCSASG